MLTITDTAFARLHELLGTQPTDVAARITRKGDRIHIRRGKQRPGDQVVEHKGRVVLLFGESIAERLQGRVLDVRKTEAGPKLGLRRNRNNAAEN